jgi:hypothetical protein
MATDVMVQRATTSSAHVVAAADPRHETLVVARAALKRALAVRRDAELQVEQLRALVTRLEANSRV